MSSNLVIVALPADNDRVWKISSEEKPHMTLCFLGEADKVQNLDQIMQFVQHATELSDHGPFYLDVDHRGTLGPDEADVLFFSKRSWNLKWIKQFRGQLLQNNAIRTAYDSVADQYPEWTPHLTLGYPTAPAKPMPDDGFDHPIYSVEFDRIAVWTGNFEGPDFRLEWPERDSNADYGGVMAYSGLGRKPSLSTTAALISNPEPENATAQPTVEHALTLGDEFMLEHFGIKGMKWGQRKEQFQKNVHERRLSTEQANREQRPAKDIRAYPTIGPSKRSKAAIPTKGGEDHPPTQDAIKIAEAHQKLKKSGVKALTNQELKDMATRMQLENQVLTLASSKSQKSKGKLFVEDQFTNNPQNQKRLVDFGVKTAIKKFGKGAAVALV